MTSFLWMRWDPPDEEASRGQDSPSRPVLQLEEESRALGVRRCKLEDEVLPGKRAQVSLRVVKCWRLVD